mgnify:CR=1 FL=1
MEPIFLNDSAVAETVCMSPSWVRVQRYKRRNGLPHTLNIDPVMIGSSPRYRVEDVEAFIKELTSANENHGSQKGGV